VINNSNGNNGEVYAVTRIDRWDATGATLRLATTVYVIRRR